MENNGKKRPPSDVDMENEENPEDDFPMRDVVEDAFGNKRSFLISYRTVGPGHTVTAEEEGKDGYGYQFESFSETSPYNALFDLRSKMARSLATCHITKDDHGYTLLHDTLRGRITWGGMERIILVVDGIPLTMDDLYEILSTHEGWLFRLEIVDPSGDVSK
jgi:hypothetical protein